MEEGLSRQEPIWRAGASGAGPPLLGPAVTVADEEVRAPEEACLAVQGSRRSRELEWRGRGT